MEAFKLQEQLKVPVKDLSQEVKRKVGGGLSVTLRTPRVGARHAVPLLLVPAVLCTERPGRPIGGASG